MAFDKWGKFNCEILVPETITYTRDISIWGDPVPLEFKYTRHLTKSFVYKGMTEAAAQDCASAMRRRYTRPIVTWYKSANSNRHYPRGGSCDQYVLMANVNITKRDVVYDVQVTLDEPIVIYLAEEYTPTSLIRGYELLESKFKSSQYVGGPLLTRLKYYNYRLDP